MNEQRRQRAAEALLEELSGLVASEMEDPRLDAVVLTRVELAADLSNARVLVAPLPTQEESRQALKALHKAQGFLRAALAGRLPLRRVPELVFRQDRGERHAQRIDTLLGRINKRSKKAGAPLLILALWLAHPHRQPAQSPEWQRYEASASIMASTFRVASYGEHKGRLASATETAFEEARRVDRLLSNYRDDSELSRVNSRAAAGWFEVSGEFARLMARCLDYSRRGEGAFDITVGPLIRAWGFYGGERSVPASFSLQRARERVGYQFIELDLARSRIRFRRSGVELDPGGIGKGYAVDQMVEVLRRAGISRAFVSAGTSSLYALGSPPQEPRGWKVSIRDPRDEDRTAAVVYLRDESLSTSGSYEKFFVAGGVTYSHIMDPRTGYPAKEMLSTSVITPNALQGEAWTKIFFVRGAAWSARNRPAGLRAFLCPSQGPCRWLK